jgi:hypothetical protein
MNFAGVQLRVLANQILFNIKSLSHQNRSDATGDFYNLRRVGVP